MAPLAIIARALGAHVTGSDRVESSYTEMLRQHGISPVIGQAAANVPAGAEVVYSTAVSADNPERRAAGDNELHRADLLAQIVALRRCIAIAGTHGKTTTGAMLVHVLQECGLDPAYYLGADLHAGVPGSAWGSGEWIVVEADESDRSLLKLTPEIAVLTNVELDHHPAYSSRLDLEDTFRTFLSRAKQAVVWDRPAVRALAPPEAVAYDASEPVLFPGGSRFVWRGIEVLLPVPGAYNAVNAAGALTTAVLAGAEPERAAATLRDFVGASRRFEWLGRTPEGVPVYDDYAHHPTEVASAIEAARTLEPRRLVAVFQPHRYSRTRALYQPLGRALAAANVAAVLDVYPSHERAEDFPGVDGRLVAAATAEAAGGRTVAWVPKLEDARRFLAGALRAGDLCLVMGAGDVDELARSLVEDQAAHRSEPPPSAA